MRSTLPCRSLPCSALSLLLFLMLSFSSAAQTFWSEPFSNGCASGCLATGYTGLNGTWTMTLTGTNAASSNTWYVSSAENGEPAGSCGTSGTDPSLHVGSTTLGDIGAAYDASRTTDKRVESPLINCTGFSNISISFNYIGLGQTCTTDWCDALYSSDGGTTWNNLQTCMTTAVCGSSQGLWTNYTGTLPAVCDGNPNVKIGFRWRNNNSAGSDPSFAVDDITLTAVTASNTITTGAIAGSPFCACGSMNVPFTATGTFTAGNVYTAQLSDAFGSFAAPTAIGTLTSTALTGTINATIPCAIPSGSAYRVRVISSSPAVTGTDNGTDLIISLPISVSVNSPAICSGETASLVASGATAYSWSTGAVPTGVNTADASPTATTTYTVTGTSGSCVDTAHATVTVISGLTVTATNASICPGGTATLTASGATSYTWSAGATPTGTNTAEASPVTTTTYTVTGTTGTCTDTAHATVTIVSTLDVTATNVSICSGGTATITASGATTYSWSTGAVPTGVNTANASPTATTTYTVTGTSGSCTDTAHATVTVTPLPVVSVNSPAICEGETATLTVSGADSYTWSAGATSTGTATASASPATTTTYTVTGTTAGCSDTATATVTVNPDPVVTVNSPTICSGDVASLTASGASTYSWSSGVTAGAGGTGTASPTATTTYTVTGTDNGCSSTATATVTVQNCAIPEAAFSGSPTTFCQSGCTNFTDLSTNSPTSWLWLFPGGSPASSTLQNPVNICYSSQGSFSVTLIATNSYGSDTLTMAGFITVGVPESVSITGDLNINACESTTLSAFPADGTYEWGPTVNIQCEDCQTATVSPVATQDYYVTYTSPDGCSDSDTVTVTVTNIYSYFMPTGFSPNGDGLNDVIQVHGKGIDFINLKIFDRIGEKVFETSDITDSWDGRLHKNAMNSNVFVYMLEVTFCNGETAKEQGNITLVK